MSIRQFPRNLWLPVIAATVGLSAPAYGVYPTNTCVGQKLTAAAIACKQELTAWGNWEKDPSKDPGNDKRDAAITAAGAKLGTAWTAAEVAATAKGVDCMETTVSSADMTTTIAAAVSDVASTIGTGIDKADRLCRSKLIKAAGTDCLQLLQAESAFVKGLKGDPGGTKRDGKQTHAGTIFDAAWTKAACSTTTTASAIATKLSTLDKAAVTDTTVSPNVLDTWTMITPPTTVYNEKTLDPVCSDGSPYVYFVKRGTVNKLLVYYYGGGACWDYLTCGPLQFATYTKSTGPQDNPANATTGFGNFTDPANPFTDWNMVFLPYCTADVHWGDATVVYADTSTPPNTVTIQHKGFVNAQVVEKWTREHFVNPDVVFVAGSSAGGYGALLNSLYLQQNVYQASTFRVLDDAGNGVITPEFQTNDLGQWGIQATLPKWIPGFNKPLSKLSISGLAAAAANFYPRANFAQYTTAWDNVQTQFYNAMANSDADLLYWWHSTCDWHGKMHTLVQASAAAAPSNYRYYIGAGTRHTVWGFDKIYTDTTGSVPAVVDWINDMLAGSPSWTSVECTDCSLEPTDERPSPLVAPFGPVGTVTCP
jgi:hypothetical protein